MCASQKQIRAARALQLMMCAFQKIIAACAFQLMMYAFAPSGS